MTKFSNINTLIFDFGGVLINLDRDLCVSNFKSLGITEIDQLLDNYVQSGLFLKLEKGLISPTDFRNELRKMTDKPVSDSEIDLAWHSFLLDIPRQKLEMLLLLRKRFRVIMLSNTNKIHFDYCREVRFKAHGLTLDDYFDKCYLSYEMGMAKPDAEIFHKLLQEEGAEKPENFLFLDDGALNIAQASSIGIQTYHVSAHENLDFLLNNNTFE